MRNLFKKNLIERWIRWHYSEMLKEIWEALWNLVWFNFHFFSIKHHLKTIFSHWRQYRESYGRGFDIKRYASAFIFNMISRTIGLIIRTTTITISLISGCLVFGVLIIGILFWLLLPLIEIGGVIFAFKLWI